jgi:hypothetical protein
MLSFACATTVPLPAKSENWLAQISARVAECVTGDHARDASHYRRS